MKELDILRNSPRPTSDLSDDYQYSLPDLRQFLLKNTIAERYDEATIRTSYSMFVDEKDLAPEFRDTYIKNAIVRLSSELSGGPSKQEIDGLKQIIQTAVDTSPDEAVIYAAVGWLLDSRSKQPPQPEVYFKTIVYDLVDEGFSPFIVVEACQQARRTLKFLPEVSEIIEICREVEYRYRSQIHLLKKASDRRSQAEYTLKGFQNADKNARPTLGSEAVKPTRSRRARSDTGQ